MDGQYSGSSLCFSTVVSNVVLAIGPKNWSLGADLGEKLELYFPPYVDNTRPHCTSALPLNAEIYTSNMRLPILSLFSLYWRTSDMF